MDVPGLGPIGHELTILNYIGRACNLAGANDQEFVICGQVMQLAEDIYNKLVTFQPTILDPKQAVVDSGKTAEFWAGTDASKHNYEQGLGVFLSHLERFHSACASGGAGYTAAANSVGECKLCEYNNADYGFQLSTSTGTYCALLSTGVTLHSLVLIKGDVLAGYAGVAQFYTHFAAMPASKAVIENGSRFPHAFVQYYVAGAGVTPAAEPEPAA